MDIEWSHAMAPGAKIVLVEAASNSLSDLMQAVDKASVLAGTVTRCLWCLVLELPWCLLGQSMAAAAEENPRPPRCG